MERASSFDVCLRTHLSHVFCSASSIYFYPNKYTTQTSFLMGVKMLETVVTPITLTQAECVAIWETKECKSGQLEGSDGVYYTRTRLTMSTYSAVGRMILW